MDGCCSWDVTYIVGVALQVVRLRVEMEHACTSCVGRPQGTNHAHGIRMLQFVSAWVGSMIPPPKTGDSRFSYGAYSCGYTKATSRPSWAEECTAPHGHGAPCPGAPHMGCRALSLVLTRLTQDSLVVSRIQCRIAKVSDSRLDVCSTPRAPPSVSFCNLAGPEDLLRSTHGTHLGSVGPATV